MKFRLLLPSICLIGGGAIALLTSCERNEAPGAKGAGGAGPGSGSLVFEPEVFTYEADPSETEFTATFSIRNVGSKPVRITKLDSTCTCINAEADRVAVEPGETGKVTALFDISKLTGKSTKSVIVFTDDPDMPRKRLGVEVDVPPIVEISPNIVEWNLGEAPRPKEIVFKVLRKEPIRIVDARSSRRQVSLEIEEVEEGREYRLVLTPSSTDDILLGFVSMNTDCELEQHQRQMAYFAVKDSND